MATEVGELIDMRVARDGSRRARGLGSAEDVGAAASGVEACVVDRRVGCFRKMCSLGRLGVAHCGLVGGGADVVATINGAGLGIGRPQG